MDSNNDFLAKESELLLDEIKRYNSNNELPFAAKSLMDFQKEKRHVDTAKEMHLPTPLLGYKKQKVSVLVMSICGEFKRENIRDLPKNIEEMIDYYSYSGVQNHTNSEDANAFDHVRNFKQVNYFTKIDWILQKIWDMKEYELGNLSVYADIIPWPTPSRWTGFEKYQQYREYGSQRVRRILEGLNPKVVISLGMQASKFLGKWDVKINSDNTIRKGFTDSNIPMVSLYRPVADNEYFGYSQQETGLYEWQNKLLAHLDRIQEYLGL